MHYAASLGHLEVCQYINSNLNVKNPMDKFGITPLHNAAQEGHLDVCNHILEQLNDKNPTDDNGDTPLRETTKNGFMEIRKLFFNKGDINI